MFQIKSVFKYIKAECTMSRSFILEAHHPFCLAEPTDITENQVGYSFTKKVVAISDTNLQLCHLEYLQAIRVLANAPYL